MAEWKQCPDCGGEGREWKHDGPFPAVVRCSLCGGLGELSPDQVAAIGYGRTPAELRALRLERDPKLTAKERRGA